MRDAAARRLSLRHGFLAERAAIAWLRLKGYAILDRRYAARGGEIDVVARRGRTIAFVEVKARADVEDARLSITSQKRRRICRAVRAWLAAHPEAATMTLRADAVYLAPWRRPRHQPAAFELDLD